MVSDWTILINNIPDVLHVGDLITDLMDENDWEYHVSASSTDFGSSFRRGTVTDATVAGPCDVGGRKTQ